jgi:hypothetical protein
MNTQSTTYDSTSSFETRAIKSLGDISAARSVIWSVIFKDDARIWEGVFVKANRLLATKESKSKHGRVLDQR